MKKKVVSFLLALVLALSVIPAVAAAEAQPDEQAQITAEAADATALSDAAESAADPETPATASDTESAGLTADAPEAEPVKSSAALAPTADAGYPAITEITPSARGVTVKWTAYPGTAKYIVFTRKPSGGWKKIGSSTTESFEHAFTPGNIAYTYNVRAADKDGKFISAADKYGVTFACLPTPKLLSVTSAYKGQKFTWEPVAGANGYRVYIKNGKKWEAFADTVEPFFINEQAVSGETYRYSVRCRKAENNVPRSYFDHTGIAGTFYASPRISKFTPVNGGIAIHWNSVDGASRFCVLTKTDNGWKRLGYTDQTVFEHTGLAANTVYTYTVRCVDANNKYISSYQSKGNLSFRYLAPPEITGVTAAEGKPAVSWTGSEYIASYKVDRKEFSGKWTGVGETDALSYTDDSAKANTLYTYTVTGLDQDGKKITRYKDTNTYYVNGLPAAGKYKVAGATLTFKNGKPCQGYVKIGKKTYYYNSKGNLMKNCIVGNAKDGYTLADKNGVCCISQEIRLAAEFMQKYCTGNTLKEKAKNGFMVLARKFPYRRSYDHPKKASDIAALAIDMFQKRSGNCFRYAACFTCLAKIAGYRTRMVIGYTGRNPHGWNETYVDGRWLISDPDAQLPNYGTRPWGAYMMRYHFWGLSPRLRSELIIDENGKAIWK